MDGKPKVGKMCCFNLLTAIFEAITYKNIDIPPQEPSLRPWEALPYLCCIKKASPFSEDLLFAFPWQGFIVIPDGGVDLLKRRQFSVDFVGQSRVLGL